MTGPRVDTPPSPVLTRILSPDEFDQAQYLPSSSVATAPFPDPTGQGRKPSQVIVGGRGTNLGRILSPDEFDQAEGMSGAALKVHTLPPLPPVSRDATATGMDQRTKGKKLAPFDIADPTTYANPVLRQVINPALDNPLTTIGTSAALAVPGVGQLVGLAMAGQMVHTIASYGWQKAAEMSLSPEDRARAEADPNRISGEAAAMQAAMLGLAPLIHVGVKAFRGATDVSGGMMEAGAAGVKEMPLGLDIARGVLDKSAYEARRIAEDQADLKATPLSSIITDEQRTVARRPQKEALASSVADYQARRVTEDQQDLSASRAADAERVNGPRRRPADQPAPYFESPQGAQTLGAVAARHGMPDDANPYHPSTPLAEEWKAGHDAATQSLKNISETGFAAMGGDEPSSVMLPSEGAGRAGSTVDAVARAKEVVGPAQLRELADAEWRRRGAPDTPESRMAAMEQVSRAIASREPVPSYPDGFAMGAEGRIPAASEVPGAARGSNVVPEGATTESAALANALKPSRFRAHSEDQLAEAALDAQTELERAQQAQEFSRTNPLTNERAQADMENRGVSYSDESEGTSKTADRLLARAKSTLAQIEREFALRGVSGDQLAEIMQGAKEQRAEREGMQQNDALDQLMEKFSPPDEDQTPPAERVPAGIVEGSGPVRTRGLAAGVEQKAIANKLVGTLGDLPEYNQVSMTEQASRASALLTADPVLARRVALGEAPAPDGLLPESVFVAVENRAIAEGDVATIRDLATGKLTSEATTMGQRIRALGERDPESPVAAISRVVDARARGVADVPKATEATIAQIREQLGKARITPQEWVHFVDTLRC